MLKKLTLIMLIIMCYNAGEITVSAQAADIVLRFEINNHLYTRNGVVHESADRVAPFIDTAFNRTMLPLNTVAAALGAETLWNAQTRTVIIIRDGTTLSLHVDTLLPQGMGRPAIVNGRTFVPIAYVTGMLGATAIWDASAQAVYIFDTPSSVVGTIAAPAPTTDAINFSALESRIFELINEERARHGVSSLIWHDGLIALSRSHSEDMARNNFLDHVSSDGTSFLTRLSRAGISHWGAAENIFLGSSTAEAAMAFWLNSPQHRDNILASDLTHIGVGTAQHGTQFRATVKFIGS